MAFCMKVLRSLHNLCTYMQNKYMIGSISADPLVSRLTLALLEDSWFCIVISQYYILTDGISQLGEFRVVAVPLWKLLGT